MKLAQLKLNDQDIKANVISTAVAIVLFVLAVSSRLVPHQANMTFIFSSALVFGILFPKAQYSKYALIFFSLFVSDLFLGFYSSQVFVYAGFVLALLSSTVFFKTWLFSHLQSKKIFGSLMAATLGSFVFYIISNFGVWLVDGMYAHNFSGLIECYWMAIPFYKNQFLADLVSVPAMVAVLSLVLKSSSVLLRPSSISTIR